MLRTATALLATLVLLATATPAAHAGLPLDCGDQERSQAFKKWGDPFQYRLATGGELGSEDGWKLSSGARIDGGRLILPKASSATSPASCLSLLSPTLRFMVRSSGSPLGLLGVSAVVRDGDGLLETLPIGLVTGLTGATWRPSLPMVLSPMLLPQLLDDEVKVRFRFAPALGGAFQVDDLFIDPYGRG